MARILSGNSSGYWSRAGDLHLQAKSGPKTVFANRVLSEHRPLSFVKCYLVLLLCFSDRVE